MTRDFEQIVEEVSGLVIGTVESVSPDEIRVILEIDAPHSTALNTGVPTGFPRINDYVLVPNEVGAVVGMIVWLGIRDSPFPKRKGLKDFDVIDLPFPLRKLHLIPVGTLIVETSGEEAEGGSARPFKLDRGVTAFPTVGNPVHLPTPKQLRSIVEATGVDRRIHIGTSPMAGGVAITADPDKLFGRHLAVLGNTGSGKSCTVAGLIRWSLQAARKETETASVNARFIILDPNGEYETAFDDFDPKPRVFRVDPRQHSPGDSAKPLHVPAWMWNSHEWSAFAAASHGTQRPLLMRALRELRSGISRADEDTLLADIARNLHLRLAQVTAFFNQGPSFYGEFKGAQASGDVIFGINIEVEDYLRNASQIPADIEAAIQSVQQATGRILEDKKKNGRYWPTFEVPSFKAILEPLRELAKILAADYGIVARTEDAPAPFDVGKLADHVDVLAAVEGGATSQYVASMTTRIRTMLTDERLRPIIDSREGSSLPDWLADYVGDDGTENAELTIIDLSLVPSDVISVVIAVIARLVFEATQRYMKINRETLPTVLVLEEAHTFVALDVQRESDVTTAAQMCRQTFERIAREGRKFGLGLVLSSQRPSELSQTVLAQCNTFILHRIVNDKDQELVGRLVPDSLGGLLRELSSLPSRRAIMLGWAAPIPTLVEVNELPAKERPRSKDPDFWDVWTGKEPRPAEWNKVVDDWVGTPTNQANADCAEGAETGEAEPQ